MEGLMRVLHPDVILRNDVRSDHPIVIRQGAESVATGAKAFSAARNISGYRATVNGAPGAIGVIDGKIISVAAFTVVDGRITAMDILTDRGRLAKIDPVTLNDWPEFR
jgi:RNA polymerase sigma-70 factor (ECF subfamily)